MVWLCWPVCWCGCGCGGVCRWVHVGGVGVVGDVVFSGLAGLVVVVFGVCGCGWLWLRLVCGVGGMGGGGRGW